MTTDLITYAAYFHDGSIFNIQHVGNDIEISMDSAEMPTEGAFGTIKLSEIDSIRGKLHIECIKLITINGQIFSGKLRMLHDSAYILHLSIKKHQLLIELDWVDFPPKPSIEEYSSIEIDAERIYWENIPNLVDPFS